MDLQIFGKADLEQTHKNLVSDTKHNSDGKTSSKARSNLCKNPKRDQSVPNHDHGSVPFHYTWVEHNKVSGQTPSKLRETRALKSQKILRSSFKQTLKFLWFNSMSARYRSMSHGLVLIHDVLVRLTSRFLRKNVHGVVDVLSNFRKLSRKFSSINKGAMHLKMDFFSFLLF